MWFLSIICRVHLTGQSAKSGAGGDGRTSSAAAGSGFSLLPEYGYLSWRTILQCFCYDTVGLQACMNVQGRTQARWCHGLWSSVPNTFALSSGMSASAGLTIFLLFVKLDLKGREGRTREWKTITCSQFCICTCPTGPVSENFAGHRQASLLSNSSN